MGRGRRAVEAEGTAEQRPVDKREHDMCRELEEFQGD